MIRRVCKITPLRLRRVLGIVIAGIAIRIIDLGLRYTSYKRVCKLLLSLSPTPEPSTVDLKLAKHTAKIVNAAANIPSFQGTCLRRSLALWWLLRWLAIPSALRFGINRSLQLQNEQSRNTSTQFTNPSIRRSLGHTWVEHANQVINDQEDVAASYAILYHDELLPEKVASNARFASKT